MQPVIPFSLPESEAQAIALQSQLAHQIITTDKQNTANPINIIAGVDVAYCNDSDVFFAAVVLLDAQTLAVTVTTQAKALFPYIVSYAARY
ncbi:endonuclease V [Shewanella surugensis]|uniref:Endonuclease V n=1 Tax=Shewanella surugensis TaxID=212020 RepID=A0ABT0LB27_9GAMM|nr:endonuclease V [Shewanella surugensis]MCL1124557.1 endonuclease V [Shewanella surugensis]